MSKKDQGVEGIYELDLPSEAYRGLAVPRLDIQVEDSLVEERVHELLEKVSWRELSSGETVEAGDTLVLSYDGTVGSERIGPVEVRMRIGSGEFIPAFEEKLIGRAAGEELLLTLTLPTPFVVKEWEGALADVDVRIRSASRAGGYELTDAHVQSVSDFSSVDELRDAIRQQFEEESAQEERRLMLSRLAEMIGQEAKARLSDEDLLAFALASPDHAGKEAPASEEERQALVDEAAFEVAWRNIARLEGITGQEEAERALANLRQSVDLSGEAAENALECIRDEVMCDEVMELVLLAAQEQPVGEGDGHEQ